ncbi:MAG TPA: LLM class F420-dependent oxidoreductase [Acidimicrobiia bacterium]|nr:LLM class F420-dependent oxidoreductase [Acidimicrobiia bacterium]
MRHSIGLPTDHVEHAAEFVTGDAVMEMAAAAEAAGFDAVFVTDHPAPDAKWLAAGGHHALEPMVALSFAAAATTTLRVQTHIMVLAYRNPFLAAKAVLSLDVLSRGRVILGVASGYLKPEFGALGVDFEERNELTDEAIDVMRAVWTTDDVAWQGRHFSSRGVTMRPRPPNAGGPPIWIGGNSTAAIRRAVERGQGWVPFPNPRSASRAVRTAEIATIDDLARGIDLMHELAAERGRTDPLDVCFSPFDRQGPGVRDEVEQLASVGVTWSVLGVDATSRAEWIDRMRALAATLQLTPARSAHPEP